ncbi:MAG: hypothetical protein ACP5QA_14125 [Phycisphaerae bacterium]
MSCATSSLSANYTPPSGVSEGDLSASYDWSVTSVLITGTQNGTYATASSSSYNASISPAQPSASSSATLRFTPLIAGYWEVSVSCSVTVTDTKTNQCWSGSANAGPQDLTSYILYIDDGVNIDGQTQIANVGDKEQLVAQYGPSDMDLKWTVQGSIIANYTVTNSGPKYSDIDHTRPSTAKITPVTASELAQPLLAYYWMDTDSGKEEDEKVTLAGTLPSGKSPPPAITTFDVDRPAYTFFASYPNGSPISLASGAVYNGAPPGGNGEPGIQFDFF